MPLMRCSQDGQLGWKWGHSGACYIGPDARKKAIEQAKAILASKADKK